MLRTEVPSTGPLCDLCSLRRTRLACLGGHSYLRGMTEVEVESKSIARTGETRVRERVGRHKVDGRPTW